MELVSKHFTDHARPSLSRVICANKQVMNNMHINASDQSISMISKLIESANHLCMLFASIKHMADLSEQSPNVAKQDSSTKGKVVSTPHSELSTVGCSLRETSCLERKGYLSQPTSQMI